jgi:hypothetical protein
MGYVPWGEQMKPTGPVITLLGGAALSLVLFGLSAEANSEDKARAVADTPAASPSATSAAADPSPSPTVSGTTTTTTAKAAVPPGGPTVTWAGRVGEARASIAISARNGGAVAYFCDGKKIEGWFLGTASDGKLDLAGNKAGDRITGGFGNGKATGTVTVGGKSWPFVVKAVSKPSGLYRASAKVRGAKVVGGWIVLSDGSQVGVLNTGGNETAAPPISVSDGAVTVDGQSVPVAAVEGSITPGS